MDLTLFRTSTRPGYAGVMAKGEACFLSRHPSWERESKAEEACGLWCPTREHLQKVHKQAPQLHHDDISYDRLTHVKGYEK